MKPGEFIGQLDDARICDAITNAEAASSGEIRVYVSHQAREDALAAAQRQFEKLGMTKTKRRNAVLLYFAPRTQQFAVWGDVGVDEKCGTDFWKSIVAEMSTALKAGRYTDAVVLAVQHIGEVLARHFPRDPGDIDELPNQVARD